MAIQAVIGEVNLPSHKPFCPGAIPFENLVPLFEPVEFAGNVRPEFVGLVYRFLIKTLVFIERLYVGLLGEFGRALELASLIQNGIDIRALGIDASFIGHDENLDAEELFLRAGNGGTRSQELFYTAPGRM
jgi:hypothetical protein